jgi:magnesium chelatase family protein
MSVAVLYSRSLTGVFAPLVTVEVHLAGGLPAINIVGLPEAEVRESRDRVKAALQNAGFEFPQRKVTINLAPADVPKELCPASLFANTHRYLRILFGNCDRVTH